MYHCVLMVVMSVCVGQSVGQSCLIEVASLQKVWD